MLKKLPNILIYSLLASLLCVALLVSGISVAVKRHEEAQKEAKRTETVLKIGDKDVPKDEFLMFCAFVVSSDIDSLRPSSMVEDALENAVKEKAAEYELQYSALCKEAKAAGVTLSEIEKAEIRQAVGNDGGDSYFLENYGVTEDKFIEISENWKICEKYLENIENEPDFSAENMEKFYSENPGRLATVRVKLIFFDTASSANGNGGLNKLESEDTFERLKEAPELFDSLYEEYNDPGFPGEGCERVLGEKAFEAFPEVFSDAISGEIGELVKTEFERGVAVFEILEKSVFDPERDGEKVRGIMTEEAREAAVKSACEKYEIVKTEAFSALNVKHLFNERSNEN